MTFLGFSGLVNFITCISIAIFVLFKNIKNPLNISFFNLNLSVALYSFGYFFWQLAKNESQAFFWFKILAVGIILINITYLYFVFHFLGLIDEKRNLLRVYTFINFIFIGLNLSSNLYTHLEPRYNLGFWPIPTIFFHIYLIFWFWQCFYGFYWLLKGLKLYTGIKRQQIKYFTISAVLGFAGGATNWPGWYNINFPPYLNITISLYIGIVAYAIFRYRLLDINIALTRAGIFVIVYLLVLGIPFWIGFRFLGKGAWILPVSVMAVFATLGPFIYMYLRERAEDVLLKDQHRYQEILRKLSATLTLVKDLNRLLKLVVLRGARAVKVDFACIYLANENKLIQKYPYTIKGFFPDFPKELSFDSGLVHYITSKRKPIFAEELVSMTGGFNLRSGLIVPSFVRKRLLGFLVLGPKASGAIYTQEDANMFGILANQLALAIENSQFIDEHERTQAELFSRERMASLGTMAGGMTHQINNRFNAISMATSDTIDTLKFIDPNSCSQEAKEYLQQIKHALTRIQENALRGGKLVNDFLNFSQPDRLQKEAKIFNLPEPLERGIEMARIKTAFSQDTIQKEIQESPFLIRGSFEMIQDMYFNLTDNAIDALDKKDKAIQKKELTSPEMGYKGKIIIKMYKEDSFAVTKIQDNGIGMTKEQTEKLFTPFFSTKGTAIKGTGFGLFVIYKIIEAHGGTIEVESEYGKGTTFTIKLPLAKQGE